MHSLKAHNPSAAGYINYIYSSNSGLHLWAGLMRAWLLALVKTGFPQAWKKIKIEIVTTWMVQQNRILNCIIWSANIHGFMWIFADPFSFTFTRYPVPFFQAIKRPVWKKVSILPKRKSIYVSVSNKNIGFKHL